MSISIAEGTQISSGIYNGKMDALSTIGCFATPTPMVDHGSYIYQSSGNCQKICYSLGMPVMGMTSGTNCSCGELLPPKDSQVDDGQCSTTCVGFDKESCGGADLWWVLLTGYSHNAIANLDPESTTSRTSTRRSTTRTHASVVTVSGGTTVFQTVDPSAAATTSPQENQSGGGGGSNTVGIAVGVVVGVVVLGAIIGGVLFFLRRRQRKLAQADYEQKQSVQQFVGGNKGYGSNSQTSSMGDSRLDPDVMFSRRQSDGSIMDNADYSRRILKVTN